MAFPAWITSIPSAGTRLCFRAHTPWALALDPESHVLTMRNLAPMERISVPEATGCLGSRRELHRKPGVPPSATCQPHLPQARAPFHRLLWGAGGGQALRTLLVRTEEGYGARRVRRRAVTDLRQICPVPGRRAPPGGGHRCDDGRSCLSYWKQTPTLHVDPLFSSFIPTMRARLEGFPSEELRHLHQNPAVPANPIKSVILIRKHYKTVKTHLKGSKSR